MKKNLLLTGAPGVGKTTLIRKLLPELQSLNPVGFYTAEIRRQGIRQGFSLVSLTGEQSLLASRNLASPHRVGQYGVDLVALEDFLSRLPFWDPASRLIVIDEIGKMECFSRLFADLVLALLASPKLVVATVARQGAGLIARVKQRHDVQLIEITIENRNSLLPAILRQVFSNLASPVP